jgi:hypothetical protein
MIGRKRDGIETRRKPKPLVCSNYPCACPDAPIPAQGPTRKNHLRFRDLRSQFRFSNENRKCSNHATVPGTIRGVCAFKGEAGRHPLPLVLGRLASRRGLRIAGHAFFVREIRMAPELLRIARAAEAQELGEFRGVGAQSFPDLSGDRHGT